MKKTILITRATEGIGLEAAKRLVAQGHFVLLQGRNPEKLAAVQQSLLNTHSTESYIADLSSLGGVEVLAKAIIDKHESLDVLINNPSIIKTPNAVTKEGLDSRFVMNTLAPYRLTKRLLPLLGASGRVINLSSAVQTPVQLRVLSRKIALDHERSTSARAKLAITSWSLSLASSINGKGPIIVAINPSSLLLEKMIKEGFSISGNDITFGADIVVRAAVSDKLFSATGAYYDDDCEFFVDSRENALNKAEALLQTMNTDIARIL